MSICLLLFLFLMCCRILSMLKKIALKTELRVHHKLKKLSQKRTKLAPDTRRNIPLRQIQRRIQRTISARHLGEILPAHAVAPSPPATRQFVAGSSCVASSRAPSGGREEAPNMPTSPRSSSPSAAGSSGSSATREATASGGADDLAPPPPVQTTPPPSPPRTRLQKGIKKPKIYTDGTVRYGMLSVIGEPCTLTEALDDSN
jgi:hypothetical protein